MSGVGAWDSYLGLDTKGFAYLRYPLQYIFHLTVTNLGTGDSVPKHVEWEMTGHRERRVPFRGAGQLGLKIEKSGVSAHQACQQSMRL